MVPPKTTENMTPMVRRCLHHYMKRCIRTDALEFKEKAPVFLLSPETWNMINLLSLKRNMASKLRRSG
jgi:hypothetical protein